MAQIDIKNCFIRLRDGYTGATGAQTGAVNNVAGYPLGTATMTVDGFTGILATGEYFRIAGQSTDYKVTAHTETTGATTSITFTPTLTAAVLDNVVLTTQSHFLIVKIGEGNLTWSEKRGFTYVKDRGKLSTVKENDEEPVDVKLDFMWEFLKSDTGEPLTVEEALKREGAASAWLSASSDPCEPFSLDIEVEYIPPCTGVKREIYLIQDYRYEELAHDLKAGTVSTSGKANITRVASSRVA